jgi:ABC-type Fe2+-enterobactin transport system substrate-binding protein
VDGDSLVFSSTDKPIWASLNKVTGRLTGTPTSAQAGLYQAIEISVSDGYTRTKLPKFSVTVIANSEANRAPSISGTPIGTVVAGQGYSFLPTASDADGDTLVFSVTSKPSWASLNKATGRLTGTPTNAQAGMYEEIEISVSDGSASAKLPKYTIEVSADVAISHTVTLSWLPPTTNTDGTTLTDLAGYRILYGSQSGKYVQSVDVNSAGLTRYVLESLPSGTYYFAMTARNSGGSESAVSAEVRIDLS